MTKTQWDAVEDKNTALLYAGGAFVALYVVNAIVGAVNSLPIVPKLMELIGLSYTVWFTYRYLIFKSSREELKKEVEELKSKVSTEASSTLFCGRPAGGAGVRPPSLSRHLASERGESRCADIAKLFTRSFALA